MAFTPYKEIKVGEDCRKNWPRINEAGALIRELDRRLAPLEAGLTRKFQTMSSASSGLGYQFKIIASKMVIGGYEDGNYILGRKWNESTGTVVASDGSADFWILRPWCLRPLSSRTTRGITVTYVYDADFTTRVASASGHPNENQRIVPNYEAGDVVDCLKLEFPFSVNVTPSGAPTYVDVKYVDVTPGRAWARTY